MKASLVLLVIVFLVGCKGRDCKDREIDGMKLGWEFGYRMAWQHQFDTLKNIEITGHIYDSVYAADSTYFEETLNKHFR